MENDRYAKMAVVLFGVLNESVETICYPTANCESNFQFFTSFDL